MIIQIVSRHSLYVSGAFKPEKVSLKLNNKQSTITVTAGPEASGLTVGDWLRCDSGPAKGIVFRVKSIETGYAEDTRVYSCEHLINILSDFLLFGEITPATITGDKNAKQCEANQVLRYLLSQSQDWVAGSVIGNETGAYTFNGDDILSAVESMSTTLQAQEWMYDFSTYPFKLTIGPRAVNSGSGSVMRMNRNIKTIRKTVDKTRMYTRFYPIGKNDLHLPENYISMNEGRYGVICRTETNENMTTVEDLRAWARGRIMNHAEPQVTVSISGLDLSAVTGEAVDSFEIGQVCEVPLPEYGTTIEEYISELSWSDLVNDPTNVTVTLANIREDVASLVNKLQKASGSRGRSGATATSKSLKDVKLTGPANNVYTLTKVLNDGKEESIGNFSRAITDWTVTAASGTIMVMAKPQNQQKSISVRQGTMSRNGYVYTGPIEFSSRSGHWAITGANIKVDATAVYREGYNIGYNDGYTSGWDNAAGLTEWPARAESGEVLSFKVSAPMHYEKTPGTWVREKVTRTFTLTEGTPGFSGYAAVNDGTNVVARIQVGDWYAAGWDNAAAMTVWPPRAETGEEVLTFDVSAPMYYEKTPGTWVREKVTRTFTLTEGTPGPSGFIGVSDGTNVVARIDVSDWYSTGYTDGYAAAGTTDISNARARFNSAPNQYYIEAFNVNNNNPVANSALYYQLGRSGNKIQIQNTSGTKYGSTQEYTLTEHSNCAQGLHRAMVSGNPIHDKLYYKDGSVYKEVTGSAQYWYYKDSNQSLTTYYT